MNDVLQETADDIEHEPFRQFLRDNPEFRPQEKDFAMKSYGKRSPSEGTPSPLAAVEPEYIAMDGIADNGAREKMPSSAIDTDYILPGKL